MPRSYARRKMRNGIILRESGAISQIYFIRFHIVTKYLTLSRREVLYEERARFVCPTKFTPRIPTKTGGWSKKILKSTR